MLNPGELPLTARKETIGVVYLRAIAAVAGYDLTPPVTDYDSIDAKISSREGVRKRLEFQVKCTSLDLGDAPDFPYELKVKNYDDLRAETIVPRYLLVVVVPESPHDWLRQNEKRLHLRRCGYWASLRDTPPTTNEYSVTVRLQRSNVLTPASLSSLMRSGGPA